MNLPTLTPNSSTENGMRAFYGTFLAIPTLLVLVPCLLGMPRINAIPSHPSADYVCYAVFVVGFTLKYGIAFAAMAATDLGLEHWNRKCLLTLVGVATVTFASCLVILRWWLPLGLELWKDGWILCVMAAPLSFALALIATPLAPKPAHASA